MSLADLQLKTEYRTSEDNLVADFYQPCLSQATAYHRAVGFFRSSVFVVAGGVLVDFAKRGGILKLVCSPDLKPEDVEAAKSGYETRDQIFSTSLVAEISRLLDDLSTREATEILATLIAAKRLELRVAFRPEDMGPFHEKLGIFLDSFSHSVSFKGSSNETWHGWHCAGNHESFEVFRSWTEAGEQLRIQKHSSYFERLWRGWVPNVETVRFPEAAERILASAARPSFDAFILRPTMLLRRQPLKHQIDALESWIAAGKRGILKHATGSGKTFTALCALKEHLSDGGTALVLVPGALLANQWSAEIRSEFRDVHLLTAGAAHTNWRAAGRLEAFTCPDCTLGKRIVISTIQTASKDDFLRRVRCGDHLMVVADEVHRLGSSEFSKVLSLCSGPRIGLSATPERYGDPSGTKRIFDYFGSILEPEFSLQDAIRAGRLVPYEYHPHPISLTNAEQQRWSDLTDRIRRELRGVRKELDAGAGLPERLKLLLIARARIAKKAAAKAPLALELLNASFEEGQRWLVYCEDSEQLADVHGKLRRAGLPAVEYHSQMHGAPSETLLWFKDFGGIAVAIRCLDEGVDIPETSHALILASSQNPREFIQRRGRVLRSSPGKHCAVVHDALVIPKTPDTDNCISLIKSELARALEFASSALNAASRIEILRIAVPLGIDPDDFAGVGVEEDEQPEH